MTRVSAMPGFARRLQQSIEPFVTGRCTYS
jgi:hypothetical protein